MDVRRALADSAKGALYFLVLGPPIGALVMTAAIGLLLATSIPLRWESMDQALVSVGGLGAMAMATTMFSWVLGSLPALVTGALVGPWRWRFHQWRWCLVAGVVGGAASVVFFLLWVPLGGDTGGLVATLSPFVPGFGAGALVARVFAMRAPYPPPKAPPLPVSAGIGDSP